MNPDPLSLLSRGAHSVFENVVAADMTRFQALCDTLLELGVQLGPILRRP